MTESLIKLAQVFGLDLYFDLSDKPKKKPPTFQLPEQPMPLGHWNRWQLSPEYYLKRQGFCGTPKPPRNPKEHA